MGNEVSMTPRAVGNEDSMEPSERCGSNDSAAPRVKSNEEISEKKENKKVILL